MKKILDVYYEITIMFVFLQVLIFTIIIIIIISLKIDFFYH